MKVAVRVACYSGYTYAQEPRVVEWGDQRYEVKRILKRWRAPDSLGFRVEVCAISSLQPLHPWQRATPQGGQGAQISHTIDLIYREAEDGWIMIGETLIEEDQR